MLLSHYLRSIKGDALSTCATYLSYPHNYGALNILINGSPGTGRPAIKRTGPIMLDQARGGHGD